MGEDIKPLLNVGDEVACYYAGNINKIVKVARITATQSILPDGTKLRRGLVNSEDLREVGADAWSQRSFGVATDNDRHQLRLRVARQKVALALNQMVKAVESGSLEYVEAVAALINPNPLKP